MRTFDPIVEEYFETRPELLNEINDLERRHMLSLWKKLKGDQNEINFFSWVSEIRFGLFFDKVCSELKNDFVIDCKKPDWLITMNDQKILAEVVRLNAQEDEQKSAIDMSRQLRKFEKDNSEASIVVHGTAKVMSLEFLGGSQSKLQQKEEKYREIIRKYKLPFIVCVATSLHTHLFESAFYHFLMGDNGFYKCDEYFGQNVTGVLLNTPFNEFYYFPNDRSEFELNEKTISVFSRFFYKKR